MAFTEKVLWVVNYNTLSAFAQQAAAAGATAVAVRTDNDVEKAINLFHAKNIKVYGWRWPSAFRDSAMKEAKKAVQLLEDGLDGYYVDPEEAKDKHGNSLPYDWEQPGLDKLAEDFCETVAAALKGRPFGVTSHYRAKLVFPKLPWAAFFKSATVLLPQAYWRSSDGKIGHGEPAGNYVDSIAAWQKSGGQKSKIVPMAGEINLVTPKEIEVYGATATAQGVSAVHFYAASNGISKDVWAAISKV